MLYAHVSFFSFFFAFSCISANLFRNCFCLALLTFFWASFTILSRLFLLFAMMLSGSDAALQAPQGPRQKLASVVGRLGVDALLAVAGAPADLLRQDADPARVVLRIELCTSALARAARVQLAIQKWKTRHANLICAELPAGQTSSDLCLCFERITCTCKPSHNSLGGCPLGTSGSLLWIREFPPRGWGFQGCSTLKAGKPNPGQGWKGGGSGKSY